LNSEYFWYPDLEEEALDLGWKPRGKDVDSVPWKRKDRDDSKKPGAVIVTPQKTRRRKKR